MARPIRRQADKEIRLHFIPEWAERRGLRQADLVDALGGAVDKSTVSRWFSGTLPARDHLAALQGLFELEEASALFRHPDDDWLARFFRSRTEEERYRIRQILEAAFPQAKAS